MPADGTRDHETYRKPRYCGAWHNPDESGIGDANCAREPGHPQATPHSGMGGDPLWFDTDPTANLNDEAGYDEGSERKAYDLGWTDERSLTLTREEWDDLSHMVEYFRLSTIRLTGRASLRQHALAERIIEANQP